MRCINCGWENPNDAKNCEKCNTPLTKIEKDEITVKENTEFSQTIIGKAPNGALINEFEDSASIKTSEQLNTCPECGYPLMSGTETCPNCKKEVGCEKEIIIETNGTIDPYRAAQNLQKCVLKPVSRIDEKSLESVVFTEIHNIVNRKSVEPANTTISSKCQAELIYKDDKWFIIDRSSTQTTFVLAKEFTELKNGDVILLGDRKFNVEI